MKAAAVLLAIVGVPALVWGAWGQVGTTPDDTLTVTTRLTELKGVRIQLLQEVLRDETLLFRADVTIVALREDGKPARIPRPITLSLQQIGD
jgi:acyl-CoA thioesterase FadM